MAVQASTLGSFEFTSFVRGHHVYCNVWTPVVNKVLTLKREPDNSVSVHTVALTRDGEIAGHIPYAIARVVLFFLARGGHSGSCVVIGPPVNCGVQLGVEVPCLYKLYGRQEYVQRLKTLLSYSTTRAGWQ